MVAKLRIRRGEWVVFRGNLVPHPVEDFVADEGVKLHETGKPLISSGEPLDSERIGRLVSYGVDSITIRHWLSDASFQVEIEVASPNPPNERIANWQREYV